MKILLIEPAAPRADVAAKISRFKRLIEALGHQVLEQPFDASLYARVIDEKPEVVFNLASCYDAEKTSTIPAILEIAGRTYTGSGFLPLPGMQPTRLVPMLASSAIPLPPFRIIHAGDGLDDHSLQFPLMIYRNGGQNGLAIPNKSKLKNTLSQLPPQEETLLCERREGSVQSVYMLASMLFPRNTDSAIQAYTCSAYELLEGRGLARFDFIPAEKSLLTGIEAAPDPLDEALLKIAAHEGLTEQDIIQAMITHAGCD
jgi:hypothetical protein